MPDYPTVTKEEMAAARIAAFENARELVLEAELLLSSSHTARALFLAQIAGEEIGKAFLLAGFAMQSIAAVINWKRFWKSFRSHAHKMEAVMLTESALSPALDETERASELHTLKERARQLETMKLASLYVDFFSDLSVSAPRKVIQETTARNAVEWAKGRIALFEMFQNDFYDKKPPEAWTKEELLALRSRFSEIDVDKPLEGGT